ncbi:MAG TPA: nuclear transport factor 2 family protein [Candidatus Dormibacteraeota bacterium]|nr:nuclear transport factor 2 family protein [Candidatus Dormibacteraeota bacterium]
MFDGMDLWQLAAREEIRELVAAYAHAADSGRFDEVVGLFTLDGVLETPDHAEHRGHEAIRAFLGGTGRALAGAMTAPLIRHHLSNLTVAVTGPDDATGAAYFFVVTERGPDHWGRYRDRYTRGDEGWRFAHRRVRLDGYTSGSWVAERRR